MLFITLCYFSRIFSLKRYLQYYCLNLRSVCFCYILQLRAAVSKKSGKILISWQELKNRFLSFLEADMKRDARLPAKSLLFARKIRISLFGVGVSEWPNNSFSFTRRYFQGNMEAPKEGLPSSGEEVKGNFYNFSP